MSKARQQAVSELLEAWHAAFQATPRTAAECCQQATTDKRLDAAIQGVSQKATEWSADYVAAAMRFALKKPGPWRVAQKRMFSSSGNRMASQWIVERA